MVLSVFQQQLAEKLATIVACEAFVIQDFAKGRLGLKSIHLRNRIQKLEMINFKLNLGVGVVGGD